MRHMVLFCAFALCARADDLRVYYIPFAAKTSAITFKNIESSAMVTIIVKSVVEADMIRSCIHPDQSEMSKKNIRLKIILGNDEYHFDHRGNGITGKGAKVSIDVSRFESMVSWRGISLSLNKE